MDEINKRVIAFLFDEQTHLQDYSGLCPKCQNPIRYTTVSLPFCNDIDHTYVKCEICNSEIDIPVYNKEFFSIHSGAKEIDIPLEEEIKEIQNNKCFDFNSNGRFLDNLFVHLMNGKISNPFTDNNYHSIYSCSCGEKLDQAAQQIFCNIFSNPEGNFSSAIKNVCDFNCKNGYSEDDGVVIELSFLCPKCKEQHIACFYTHCFLYGMTPAFEHYFLYDVSKGHLSDNCGIFLKNTCYEILKKFLVRWYLLADKIYVCTPFVGHQYLETKEIMSLWKDIFCYLPSERTQLISKAPTINAYKKQNEKYEEDKIYGNLSPIYQHAIKINLHAKFYAAVINDTVELLTGSFNLCPGKNYENFVYIKIPVNTFIEKYLKPLEIDIINISDQHHRRKVKRYYLLKFDHGCSNIPSFSQEEIIRIKEKIR